MRFCLKKMGPRESILMKMAKIGISQERMRTTIIEERTMSMRRLTKKKLAFRFFTASFSCSLCSSVYTSLSNMAEFCVNVAVFIMAQQI